MERAPLTTRIVHAITYPFMQFEPMEPRSSLGRINVPPINYAVL
jgi:hypothetical protein